MCAVNFKPAKAVMRADTGSHTLFRGKRKGKRRRDTKGRVKSRKIELRSKIIALLVYIIVSEVLARPGQKSFCRAREIAYDQQAREFPWYIEISEF